MTGASSLRPVSYTLESEDQQIRPRMDCAPPRHRQSKRVTAYMRLSDQTLHAEAVSDLKSIKLEENRTSVRQAPSWPSDTRTAIYNYEKDKVFICNCPRCLGDQESRALKTQSEDRSGPLAHRRDPSHTDYQPTTKPPIFLLFFVYYYFLSNSACTLLD